MDVFDRGLSGSFATEEEHVRKPSGRPQERLSYFGTGNVLVSNGGLQRAHRGFGSVVNIPLGVGSVVFFVESPY